MKKECYTNKKFKTSIKSKMSIEKSELSPYIQTRSLVKTIP